MSVLSRITRGVGYGATSLSVLGYGSAASARRGSGLGSGGREETKKTFKQYKIEYLDLTYQEIEEEKTVLQADIGLATREIEASINLDLSGVIAGLKEAVSIAKLKLKALVWVEKERLRKYRKEKQRSIDGDLVFVATYLMDDDDD